MRHLGHKENYPGANAGSLLGDVGPIAKNIHATLTEGDVVVWANPSADIFVTLAREAPDVPAEYILGTYRMGAHVADIEEDLLELRRSRVSGSMIF